MANIRAIRARIKSVESTRQITASMKMIAASKLRRVQTMQSGLERFEQSARHMLTSLLSTGRGGESPYAKAPGSSGKLCYVLFVGNRGMCGVYNIALLKFLQSLFEQDTGEHILIVCGRWGRELLNTLNIQVDKYFDRLSDTPVPEEMRQLTELLLELYMSGQADGIKLVYQEYLTVLKQQPAVKQLLPLTLENNGDCSRKYILEPDEDSIRRQLEKMYIENTVYSTALEARRGEHAARMAAMTAAADNTDELLKELEMQLNHARQAGITTEISEIVGGAAALRNKEAGL